MRPLRRGCGLLGAVVRLRQQSGEFVGLQIKACVRAPRPSRVDAVGGAFVRADLWGSEYGAGRAYPWGWREWRRSQGACALDGLEELCGRGALPAVRGSALGASGQHQQRSSAAGRADGAAAAVPRASGAHGVVLCPVQPAAASAGIAESFSRPDVRVLRSRSLRPAICRFRASPAC